MSAKDIWVSQLTWWVSQLIIIVWAEISAQSEWTTFRWKWEFPVYLK